MDIWCKCSSGYCPYLDVIPLIKEFRPSDSVHFTTVLAVQPALEMAATKPSRILREEGRY